MLRSMLHHQLRKVEKMMLYAAGYNADPAMLKEMERTRKMLLRILLIVQLHTFDREN